MRARVSFFAAIAVAAFSAIAAVSSGVESAPRSKQQRDFVVAGGDGYGTHECLASQGHCGRIVADAWCESKGFKKSLAYRQLDRDEVTGSTPSTLNAKPVESFLISCQD